MQVMVIYAHPNPRSFNAAIAAVVREEAKKKGARVKFKDLYAMNWDPVLRGRDFEGYQSGNLPADIKTEQDDLLWADSVIMIAPVWWTGVPAILKGYIDRVFSNGFAFEYTKTGSKGLLTGKKGLLITTSGADEETALQGTMIDTIRRSAVNSVFGFCGFSVYKYKNFFAVPRSTDQQRTEMLADLRQYIQDFI
ncbi:MAG: NAD(P)H-dependent oxidoreductase [Syntrophomonadaceae bacterium]